ncbi:MAG TPA: biopolymer transporter ExbD [Anaeromyxobacteraceae bacterium]|nr:biopolymer transporter ExbD [Anaeromyxobacteraceae bacterium]
MALGGPTGDHEEAEGGGIFSDINITPLTDIFLVLLIIFMVTTTAIAESGQERGGFKVSLPRGGTGDAVAVPRDLAVAVLADGRVVVKGQVVDEEALRAALRQAKERNADTLVLVQADEGVTHGHVVAVMEAARREGLTRLAIATRAPVPGQAPAR